MSGLKRLARSAVIRAVRLLAPRHGLRDTDVILAAYPKTGSTWLRFIHANLVSIQDLDGERVDYHRLNGELAAEYDPHRFPAVEYSALPRLVKTHKSFNERAFGANRSVYLYRNPADVMVSFYEYKSARKDREHFEGSFSEFIRDPQAGLSAWIQHLKSWAIHAGHALSYEEMKAEPERTVANLVKYLGGHLDEGAIKLAVERSSFSSVREMEETAGLDPRAESHLKEGFRFAREGKVGGWKQYFDPSDELWFKQLVSDAQLDGLAVAGRRVAVMESGVFLV